MMYVTRKLHFNAAHKLYNENWSAEKNEEVFGACANSNWHGHNFDLYITVKGSIDPDTGYVIDLKVLKELAKRKVVDKLDHKNINMDVPFMKGQMASTENLAIAIWDQLDKEIKALNCELHCIKLYETERNSVEYYGNN